MSKTTQRRRPKAAPKKFHTRGIAMSARSFDPNTGTFTAVAATGAPVPRGGGSYTEVLAMTPKSVRLGRLKSGRAPFLNSHRFESLSDQLGVITDARIENGQLIIDGRLSARDDVKPIAGDMANGTLSNVSVGYRVWDSEESRDADGRPLVTRTDWEPVEVSLVALPHDPAAYVRGQKGQVMDDDNLEIETVEARADDVAENPGGAPRQPVPQKRAMSDRQARRAFEMAARAHIDGEFVTRHIDDGATFEQFRTALFDELHRRTPEISGIIPPNEFLNPGRAGRTFDNPEFLGEAIEGALYARMSGKAPAEAAAQELMGRSMLDMGAMLLQARGERVSWANRDRLASHLLTRAAGSHTTSDFPNLLMGAGNRVLSDAYKAAECPLKALAKRRDANDFRAISMLRLSEAARLSEVREGGEVTYGSRSEAKEGFAVKTYAKIFSLSRQAIINDDLGAFADSNTAWGRAAAETEADLLVGLFTANANAGVNLDDGNPLYTTARKNKASSGGAIDETNFSAARQAMREMKGLDGKTPISVTPKHLVVGAAKETEAEKMLAAIAAAKTSDVNPFSGKMTLHVEPRFTGNAWRLFADPAEIPAIIIAYLNGRAGPILDTREGWSTLGAEFRAVLDFGCGIDDWRGTYLNPGN